MLLNIAQDLKEDAKVTVSPEKEQKKPSTPGEKKPSSMEKIEEAALKSAEK